MMKLTKILKEEHYDIIKLIEFPEFRQAFTYDCGATAFQAFLAFFGIDEDEETVMKELGTNEEQGTTVINIGKVAREKYGLKVASRSNLTIEQVKKLIDKGFPVLMLVQAWPDTEEKIDWKNEWNEGHYVVAIGYTKDKMIFEDPSEIVRDYIPFDELEDRWHDFDLIDGKKRIYQKWGMIFSDGKKNKYDPLDMVYMR